ncbi:GroES-like protein [Pseudovirgaria hyperparasitica]|uniref:GroES-like protein n=1 Tax=Pseudovirgaria hyperparasitica TaxID=470096 RepID=A0A6A6WKD1_9PEZI|nr:GroES-like protein [Pseudovirgaria hyperparasitica]KAF2762618.1 GroES-like protein [Pseudovirgaria hyperparasitica]
MATARAIVSHGPLSEKKWKLEDVKIVDPKDDQIVVRMVASGVCHTDINFGNIPEGIPGAQYPIIFGHEGSGYVEKIGDKVKKVAVGDPVLLSFSSCGKCRLCEDKHPAHCDEFTPLNFIGRKSFAKLSSSEPDIAGSFFGQSSFASLSVVDEKSVVNIKGLVNSKEELIKLCPLGCGIQTGTGCIISVTEAKPEDTVAVIGLGGVGLSCIMAANIAGVKTIIGVDRVESRMQLAKELGATHTINTSSFSPESPQDFAEAVQKIDKNGPTITVDTTGVVDLIHQAYDLTRAQGKIVPLGMVPPGSKLNIDITDMVVTGKKIMGTIEGDAVPDVWIPKMIQWWREGQLPFDRLIKVFKAEDFEEAVHQMHTGETVKPIITW